MSPEKAKVKEDVLRYLADHSGEINIAECAEELGLSEAEVKEAIELLQREGKIEREKVSPPTEPAPPEEGPTDWTKIIVGVVVVLAVIAVIVGYFQLTSDTGGDNYDSRYLFASADGVVYDYDNTAARENYRNGAVSITVEIKSGRLRSIGDPAYGGTIITCTNPATGFSASVSLPDNTSLWGSQITAVNTVPISAWGSDNSDVVKMTVTMSPDSQGRLSTGSLISIILAPYGVNNAHDQTVAENRMTDTAMWDEIHTINVTIAGRDSISLTGYDGAYLLGVPWTE